MSVLSLIAKKDSVSLIPLSELTANPMQPRRKFDEDEMRSLAESIKTYGVIQPIAVKRITSLPFPMKQSAAKYEIIAGERRWRASKMAGRTHIPCVILDADRESSAMMALVENLQRCDLTCFEEAIALQTLLFMTGMPQGELAKALSISQPTLSNKLRLLRLSERERLMAIENGFSERHCRALVRLDSERERRPIMLEIIRSKLTAPEAERLIDGILLNAAPKKSITKKLAKQKKSPKIKSSFDVKFLFNTMDKTVSLLRSSGYTAEWKKSEGDGCMSIVIEIKR